MRLYSVGRSPFAARVRCVIYAKGLDVDLVAPPETGLKGPEYLAINPLGRLPALVLDGGEVIPESEVIVEYLEQVFPEPAVTPEEPRARARARLIARAAELYLLGPVFELFPQLDPSHRDLAATERAFARLEEGERQLEGLLCGGAFASGPEPTVADFMTVPAWFWVGEIHRAFGREVALAD
ncbi:MAG: gst, partial [Phenylobacterium sp.]|nr:gst [Phenylobacterium sp.]